MAAGGHQDQLPGSTSKSTEILASVGTLWEKTENPRVQKVWKRCKQRSLESVSSCYVRTVKTSSEETSLVQHVSSTADHGVPSS